MAKDHSNQRSKQRVLLKRPAVTSDTKNGVASSAAAGHPLNRWVELLLCSQFNRSATFAQIESTLQQIPGNMKKETNRLHAVAKEGVAQLLIQIGAADAFHIKGESVLWPTDKPATCCTAQDYLVGFIEVFLQTQSDQTAKLGEIGQLLSILPPYCCSDASVNISNEMARPSNALKQLKATKFGSLLPFLKGSAEKFSVDGETVKLCMTNVVPKSIVHTTSALKTQSKVIINESEKSKSLGKSSLANENTYGQVVCQGGPKHQAPTASLAFKEDTGITLLKKGQVEPPTVPSTPSRKDFNQKQKSTINGKKGLSAGSKGDGQPTAVLDAVPVILPKYIVLFLQSLPDRESKVERVVDHLQTMPMLPQGLCVVNGWKADPRLLMSQLRKGHQHHFLVPKDDIIRLKDGFASSSVSEYAASHVRLFVEAQPTHSSTLGAIGQYLSEIAGYQEPHASAMAPSNCLQQIKSTLNQGLASFVKSLAQFVVEGETVRMFPVGNNGLESPVEPEASIALFKKTGEKSIALFKKTGTIPSTKKCVASTSTDHLTKLDRNVSSAATPVLLTKCTSEEKNTQTTKLVEKIHNLELLWKDACNERDASIKQWESVKQRFENAVKAHEKSVLNMKKEHQAAMRTVEENKAKEQTNQTSEINQLKSDRDRFKSLWEDTITAKSAVQLQLQDALAALQQARQALARQQVAPPSIASRVKELGLENIRLLSLWEDARRERESLESQLRYVRDARIRAEQDLRLEIKRGDELQELACRLESVLLREKGGKTKVDRIQREMKEFQQKRPSRGTANEAGKLKTPLSALQCTAAKPRVLLRTEVPQHAPMSSTLVAKTITSVSIKEDNTFRFDGATNKWSGDSGLSRLEAELEMLSSAYEEDEIKVGESQITRYLQFPFIDSMTTVTVDLVLVIPDRYPESGVLEVETHLSDKTGGDGDSRRCVMDALPQLMQRCTWEANGCEGQEAVFSVFAMADDWLQTDWIAFQSQHVAWKAKKTKKDEDRKTCHISLCRMLLTTHHLMDETRIHSIVGNASKMGLGGVVKTGKPAYLLLEGSEHDCDSFVQDLRDQYKKERQAAKANTESSPFSLSGKVVALVDGLVGAQHSLPETIRIVEGPDSMKELRQLAETCELADFF